MYLVCPQGNIEVNLLELKKCLLIAHRRELWKGKNNHSSAVIRKIGQGIDSPYNSRNNASSFNLTVSTVRHFRSSDYAGSCSGGILALNFEGQGE
jgi:hypothetical protein